MKPEQRKLRLQKHEETYIFTYSKGQEREVIDAFARFAEDPELDFDWVDASVLSYQIGQRLEAEL